jgi:phospholipid/cholesterol/gamma-HCH transport system permease protein
VAIENKSAVGDKALLQGALHGNELSMTATGAWTAVNAAMLEPRLIEVERESEGHSLFLDMRGVMEIDTFGACLLDRLIQSRKANHQEVTLTGLSQAFNALLTEVGHEVPLRTVKDNILRAAVQALGRATIEIGRHTLTFMVMLGALGEALLRVAVHPRKFRLTSVINQLDRVGLQAVPIIALITFLIGGIIAQQGIFHFRKFGAESYVVDLVGILVLRELGVLIVAIMVAGRSGSSYTAEVGSMKMREEIDALRTMGLDPVEVLLLPRVIALVLALPILTFLGSMAALYGGGVVAWVYGGMSPAIFIARLRDAISITHFEVGMIKAPFMALVIGVVASAEGLAVKGSAESLGLQTTSSVVKSIFLVIVLDGFFAIFFASIGM